MVGCHRKPESRLSYRLLLGGTRHFGYHPEGSGGLSMAEAMRLTEDRLGLASTCRPVRGCWTPAAARATLLNCTALVEGCRHRQGRRYTVVRARRPGG